MGAGPSVITKADPLAANYVSARHQVWVDQNVNIAASKSDGKNSRENSIRALASQQLLTKINSCRIAQRTPGALEKDLLYSKSFHVATSSSSLSNHDVKVKSVLTKKTTNGFGISKLPSIKDIASENGVARPEQSLALRTDTSVLTDTEVIPVKVIPNLSIVTGEPKEKTVRKKPNLIISVQTEDSSSCLIKNYESKDITSRDTLVTMSAPPIPSITETSDGDKKGSLLFRRKNKLLCLDSNTEDAISENKTTAVNDHSSGSSEILRVGSSELSPVLLSPGGKTAHVGQWRIRETGLLLSPREASEAEHMRDKGTDAFVEIGRLGSGASGTVVEAIHLHTLTIVALKVLPVHNPKKNNFLAHELAVLYKNLTDLRLVSDRCHLDNEDYHQSTPRCRYVLSMYDAFIDTRSCKINLVMEMMDGGSLQDLVQNGGCQDESVLADIAYQVSRGLQYLHSQKQMHRDIKPGNILLNSQGWIKVADFGISKAMDNTFGCAKSFVGTMCYMAPERITANNYGFPADIWSMGLTILAVCMGRFPLPDTSEGFWGLLQLICESDAPSPGPSYSAEFNEFISYCLKRDPDERWRLERLLEHPFLAGFQRGHPRRRISDSEVLDSPSRNSSINSQVSDTGGVPQSITLAKLAETKDFSDYDDINNVRLEHLKHLAEVLQARCQRREAWGTSDSADAFLNDLNGIEENSYHNDKEESMTGPPIRLPPLSRDNTKWKHLAEQLHLSVDVVVDCMRNTIDEQFFSN